MVQTKEGEDDVGGGHWFPLSTTAGPPPECTDANSARRTSSEIWRAMIARAPEWFEQPIRTESDMAAYFPTSLECALHDANKQALTPSTSSSSSSPTRWQVIGLVFADGVFSWSLVPAPPAAKLRLRLAAGTATPDAHSAKRKYRHTPAVRRGNSLPSDDEQDYDDDDYKEGAAATTDAKKNKKSLSSSSSLTASSSVSETEILADEHYHEFIAEMERCRQLRVAASRRFLERTQIRNADYLVEAAETP